VSAGVFVLVWAEDVRTSIDLENHWKKGAVRPCIPQSTSPKQYDEYLEKLLDKYPIPKEYHSSIYNKEKS
jgi:hypothetical protein